MKVKETVVPEKYIEKSVQEKCATSQLRITKNLLIVCVGYFLIYLPFYSLANLQSTLNAENNVGVVSQAIIYVTSIFSSLFLPKLIVEKLGCKNALVLCNLAYVPYFAANVYPHMVTFIPTAILLGIGCGPLWAATSAFINEISVSYAVLGTDKAEVINSRFMGIFFVIIKNTHIWGNLVSYYILKSAGSEVSNVNIFQNESFRDLVKPSFGVIRNLSCGAEFCGGMNENMLPPSQEKRYMLAGYYVCCALLSALIVFIFLDPQDESSDDKQLEHKFYSRAIATVRHLRNKNQLLLVPLTIFSGIQQAFILLVYSRAFVVCELGIHYLSLVFIFYGVMDSIMSFMSRHLIKYIPRVVLILTAAVGNIGVCSFLLLWHPSHDEFAYFFILIGLWGISDALWMTQLNASYGILFQGEEEAAFGNYKLWESVGLSLEFGYSAFFCVAYKIYILLVFLTIGVTGYVTVEILNCTSRKTNTVGNTCNKVEKTVEIFRQTRTSL